MAAYSLAGKNIVITGGSRGLGAELTRIAARQGAKTIVVGYASNAKAAEELVAKMKADKETSATTMYTVGGPLTDQASCTSFVEQAMAKLNGEKIDGLVLCAGVMKQVPLAQTTDETFAYHFDANVKGTMFTVQAALPSINADGRIVCFSTSVVSSPQASGPGYLQYVAAKNAVEGIVRTLARDPSIAGPERRIGINAIAPGPAGTALFYEGKTEEMLKRIDGLVPEQRIGTPEEMAEPAVFLLTPAARWIRGQVIRVNGGMTFNF